MGKNLLVSALSKFFNFIVSFLPPKVIENGLTEIALKVEKCNNSFFTYHLRPQKSEDIDFFTKKEYPEVGIVIQGPLVTEKDFTLETALLYQRFFKGSEIIISTWENSNDKIVNQLKKQGFTVLLSPTPSKPGALNANMQVASTYTAIQHLKKKEIKYVLKTRSDQRIYNSKSLNLLDALCQQFPAESEKQTNKIVSVNFTTLRYRPYAIADMCMFGHINDLDKYWNIKLDNRTVLKQDTQNLTIEQLCQLNVGETFYCTSYLKKLNEDTPITLENHIRILKKFFIIIDHELIDLFWHKYDRFKEHKHRTYGKNLHELYSFADWLIQEPIKMDESLLQEIDGIK